MTEPKKPLLVNLLLVLTLVVALVLIVEFVRRGMAVREQLSAIQTAPATRRTFAVVTVPLDTVKNLLTSMTAGDREAALNRIVTTDDASQREAEAVFGAPCVWLRFEKTARQAFGKQVPPSAPGSVVGRMTSDLETMMKAGWAKIDGDRAEVSIHGRPVFYLVCVDGDWKIDYDQTRKVVPSGMTASDIDQVIGREQMLQGVTADIVAGKFKTFADVLAKLSELDSAFPVQPQAHYPVANTPSDAVNLYIRAVGAGDADAMFNRLVFANDTSRREAVAVVGLPFATQRYLAVAAEVYGGDVPPVDLMEAAAAAQNLRQAIQGATLKTEGDLAELTEPSGDAIYLHRIDGDWKIDFDLLEKLDTHRYSDQEIDARCARYQAEMDMVGEIRSGRFGSFAAANAELEKRVMDAMGGPVAAGRRAAIAQIRDIRAAIIAFSVDNARYPTKDEGIQALVAPPAGVENTWHKAYDRVPRDPWGNEFQYVYPLLNMGPPFNVISAGPDGQFGTDDDIDQDTQE